MRKKLLFIGSLLFASLSFAQHVHTPNPQNMREGEDVEYCIQHVLTEKMRLEDPRRYATMGKSTGTGVAPKSTLYTIPVVFHIIHNNNAANISDAQVQDALNILNRDYRRLNADANSVHPDFQGMPADIEIQFAFATIAPNGECFEGITRTVSTWTNDPPAAPNQGQQQVNAVIAGNDVYQGVWPHDQYLNIYVATSIDGAAGYTFNPNGGSAATATNMYYNGVFILHDYCGSIGTSDVFSSRALTHEVGHWLNLSHTWGDDNNPGEACGTDFVTDTPETRGSTSCNLNENFCGPRANVENYMDYSYCSKMFTEGQKTRMRAAIVSATAGRSNIWTAANLEEVGAQAGTNLCGLTFNGNTTGGCAGTQVTFTPDTGSNPVSAYSWSFPGGTPATSTATNPVVTYNTPGTYSVTLTVTSSGDDYTKTRTDYIVIASPLTTINLPFTEGFVSATFPPSNWAITNTDGSTTTWSRSGTVGFAPTAGNSMLFDNYNFDDSGNEDEIRMPAFNMTGATNVQMSFDVAYASYNGTGGPNSDGLQVLVSTNCGGSFDTVYFKSDAVLATAPATGSQFTPTTAQWRNEIIDLGDYDGDDNVIIKFRNIAGYGNRLFIDNINIAAVSTDPPVASFTSPSSVCEDVSITFTNISTGFGNTYAWSFPGGTPSSSTAANPTVTYAAGGSYTATLVVTNANGSNSTNTSITVNAAPVVSFNSIDDLCTYDNPVVLNQGSPAGGTYSGTGVSGGQFNPATAGTGNKTLTYSYTNTNGCTATAQTIVTVSACLSVDENEAIDVKLFPNPSTGTFTIVSQTALISSVHVFDQSGRLVKVVQPEGQSATVELDSFAKGVYTVRITAGNNVLNKRVILQK